MTPVALIGLIGVAVSALMPTARETDKVSCVLAHEAAQDLQRRNLLSQSREQLLFCSDPRCPRLVAEDCQTLLVEIDRALATDKLGGANAASSSAPVVLPDETATSQSATESSAVMPAAPPRTAPPPETQEECCARRAQRVAGTVAQPSSQGTAPAPRGSSPRDATMRRPPLNERWRAPLLAGTLTVVALAGAAYFGWRGLAEAERLGRTCSPDCDPSQVSPVRRQLLIADLSLLAGVGLGALTAWTIWNGSASETAGAPRASGKRRGEPGPGAGWSLVPRLDSLQVEYGGKF